MLTQTTLEQPQPTESNLCCANLLTGQLGRFPHPQRWKIAFCAHLLKQITLERALLSKICGLWGSRGCGRGGWGCHSLGPLGGVCCCCIAANSLAGHMGAHSPWEAQPCKPSNRQAACPAAFSHCVWLLNRFRGPHTGGTDLVVYNCFSCCLGLGHSGAGSGRGCLHSVHGKMYK